MGVPKCSLDSKSQRQKQSVFNICDPQVSSHGHPHSDYTHTRWVDRAHGLGQDRGRCRLTAPRGALCYVAPQVPGLSHRGCRGEVTGPRIRHGPTRRWHSAPRGQVSSCHQLEILRHSLGRNKVCRLPADFSRPRPPREKQNLPGSWTAHDAAQCSCPRAKGSPEQSAGSQRIRCQPRLSLPSFKLFWTKMAFLPRLPCTPVGKETAPSDDWALKFQLREDWVSALKPQHALVNTVHSSPHRPSSASWPLLASVWKPSSSPGSLQGLQRRSSHPTAARTEPQSQERRTGERTPSPCPLPPDGPGPAAACPASPPLCPVAATG